MNTAPIAPQIQTATLKLLGRAELVCTGSAGASPLRFLPERRFRLLAFVALRGDWVSRDELATLFWPDRTQEAARSNLRKLLLEVRAIDVPQLESDRNGLRWQIRTDVAEFAAALKGGDAAAALALYGGALLRGLDGGDSESFSAWLANERRRLHAAWHDAAVAALPGCDPASALELARRLLDDDPFDEDAMVAALDAMAARGDGPGAADAYRGYAERLIEELGVEPSARVRAAAARATGPARQEPTALRRRATDVEAPGAAAAPDAGFIGRAQELEELSALLTNPECRLLTVTGPGGIGKSRLVKQALRRLAAPYADGVTWIALDDLTEVAQVAPRLASELGLDLAPKQDPVDRIAAHLATRRALLVLDNSEHLPRLATLIERLLAAAPQLQVLSTSRIRIGVAHEWLMPLMGLTLPAADATAGDIVAADAVQLFIAQARATDPRFNVAANAPHIATLVRAVGGLPLAILLAASWIRLVPMAELAQEVTQSLDVLERAEDGDERPEHRSVRATFEQSWRLLAPAEQRAMAALSVFFGGFTRAAAVAVANAPVLMLSSLVDKSLLQADPGGDVASLFHLHPLLRHFARSKVRAVAERRNLSARHARYFARWLADKEQALRGAEQARALAELEQHLPDCHAAWAYAVEERDAPFIESATLALMYYYEARGRRTDGIALFAAAERRFDPDAADAAAAAVLTRALSTLRYRNGEIALTIDTATRGIAVARRIGARPALKGCLLNLGLARYQRGQLDQARQCFEDALALARNDHDLPGIGAFINSLAMVEQEISDRAAAEAHYREALSVYRELQNPRLTLTALNNLALLLLEGEKAAEAQPLYEEGLRLCTEHGIAVMRANFLFGLGGARLALGQLSVARDLTLQALEASHAGGEPHVAVEAQMQLARIALAANDAIAALRLAHQAHRHAMRLENLPIQLDTVRCIAQCRAQSGDTRGAVALWLFIAAHPQTSDADRKRVQRHLHNTALPHNERARAETQSQRYELSTLAGTLAEPTGDAVAVARALKL